jgi:type III restriction enzyme
MITLKNYQKRALDALQRYLTLARVSDPKTAFEKTVAAEPTDKQPQRHQHRFELTDVPYVSLRRPTGGGKTLLAAHAVPVAAQHFMDRDFPLVLWLVPTNIIRQQTAQALKDRSHPCREALDRAFGMDKVAVFDLDEINNIRPKDLSEKTCVVVGTIQTLRIAESNKDRRKVYGHNENFEPHYQYLPNNAPNLDREEGSGQVLYSFANILHQLRPLVIVDEAHKAGTKLSGDMMRRINPRCVIEMTATPVESNILYRVYAADLKAEDMVKLPLPTTVHPHWEQAINGAAQTRRYLAEFAAQDQDDYIRPIVLIQAEKKDQEHTVEAVKRQLVESEGVAEAEIVVATGEQRGLDGINLFDKTCPINYVITIEALKEGWDCSFAYVFCSVANIRSAVDVEQLLGRVMRMPYARRRRIPELNSAYAHVIAPSFLDAADSMLDCLINMGFDTEEAAENIVQSPMLLPGFSDSDFLPLFTKPAPVLKLELSAAPNLDALSEDERGQIEVTPTASGSFTVECKGPVSEEAEQALVAAANPDRAEETRRKIAIHRVRERQQRPLTPSQQGQLFTLGQLKVRLWDSLELPETEVLLEALEWTPLQNYHGLAPDEFNYDERARTVIFDLEGERMCYKMADRQLEYALLASSSQLDELGLTRWLENKCALVDVRQVDMLEFCRISVHSLLQNAAFDLGTLCRAKSALAVALKDKLDRLRREALKRGFQQLLFPPNTPTPLQICFEDPHCFPQSGYAGNRQPYKGAFKFAKHHYPEVRDLNSSGEEFDCARVLDIHPQVVSWVRNVDRADGSFWLPTHDDKFYPDFVAKLKGGRTLVVEYKGEHLKDTADTLEKRSIGEFWAKHGEGKCLFIMAFAKDNLGRNVEDQIEAVISKT